MTALIFDCDGVLADTERYGHLPAFNDTFGQVGLPVRWNEDRYGELLKIGGGKERMATLFDDAALVSSAGLPADADGRTATLAQWHKIKTARFKDLVAAGRLPPRAGIARVLTDAVQAGWTVAVASTSAEESVRAVLEHAAPPEIAARIPVFAGDVVPAKKPDPAIYTLTVERLGLDRSDTLVVEDSRNGLLAAVGAGLPCLITVNGYTRSESFDEAALVVSELGDPGRPPIEVLADPGGVRPGEYVTLEDLAECIRVAATMPADRTNGGNP